MDKEYSIDEILIAVNDFHKNDNKQTPKKMKSTKSKKIDDSDIPKNTLRLIQQAEKDI